MRQYMQQHGTSYYVANTFFPKKIREDVFALYAFVRIPDDVVDDPMVDPVTARETLDNMWDVFEEVHKTPTPKGTPSPYQGTMSSDREVVVMEASRVFHTYDIPLQWVHDFFAAMHADLDKKVYYSYEELQTYMYGSAEVVGLMMCKIIGYDTDQEQEVFRTAKLLGEAMQYTNFLRDIVEDSTNLDRIYMPEDRLVKYSLNHVLLTQYIAGKPIDDQWRMCMSQQILQTKELYREANKGIALLDPRGRKAVRVASWMYESILDKIIRNGYDVFTKDAHTSKREKIFTLAHKSRLYACGKID